MDKLLQNPIVIKIKEALKDPNLCLVGGAVRDALEGKSDGDCVDFDFATKLPPLTVTSNLWKEAGLHSFNALRRGTVFAKVDGIRVDITTFRNPKDELKCVETIEEDLAARDFTINAIALNVNTGELIDPFNGIADIKDKVVRCVGDPDTRFTEDPHRIIRMVRFSAAAGRAVTVPTLYAAKRLVQLSSNVAMERMGVEIYKILISDFPGNGIRFLKEIGLLDILIPELVATVGCTQNKYHLHDVFEHTLSVLDGISKHSVHARAAALFHDIGKPRCKTIKEDGECQFLGHEDVSEEICKEVLARLKFSSYFTEKVSTLVKEHMRSIQSGKKGIRRLIKDLEYTHYCLDSWLELKEADLFGGRPENVSFKKEWEDFLVEFNKVRYEEPKTTNIKTLAISGKDIIGLGFKEGPIIGHILKALEELVLENPENNTREYLINSVSNNFKQSL